MLKTHCFVGMDGDDFWRKWEGVVSSRGRGRQTNERVFLHFIPTSSTLNRISLSHSCCVRCRGVKGIAFNQHLTLLSCESYSKTHTHICVKSHISTFDSFSF